MNNSKIINVISGKGGTGKTLLTAVLADMLGNEGYSVLVIDLDVFVRGLTSLLYFHKKETIQLTQENKMSVAEYFIDKGDVDISGKSKFSIERYRSFDVLPSVSRVDEILNFKDIMPDNKSEARDIVSSMLKTIDKDYDFIILDSRAGYDELISATHYLSDLSICVEEEDDISKITSDNLVKQLEEDADVPIFRVTNKARAISSEKDLSGSGIEHLGKVPFDMDVMESFGTFHFWDDISRTLYKASLARAWNLLSSKLRLEKPVSQTRMSVVGSEKLEKRLQFVTLRDRISLLYSVLITIIGLVYGVFGQEGLTQFWLEFGSLQTIALAFGFGGLFASMYLLLKGKR
ncbi:ParA family protein [Vibrio europaeus]|uniref:AAA domain-containing protein n=1 Tax=Vibrio europaeus TaxID=300876 RepID=A0A178JA55_9VIBR|nr:ParA family protein [Vibrio europaeus]MDC5704754.1 ParA family protein [Vibrio europaeus]MDC5710033.1 ParA family protein [Vibrio europaeus]MDC5715123.1 ParA family protein [Vibrio europaeus]MDC5719023.1 ParA family protein [Vibrio europaeus]MDC5844145.1 ParA family protein [Vibrio europaeus]